MGKKGNPMATDYLKRAKKPLERANKATLALRGTQKKSRPKVPTDEERQVILNLFRFHGVNQVMFLTDYKYTVDEINAVVRERIAYLEAKLKTVRTAYEAYMKRIAEEIEPEYIARIEELEAELKQARATPPK
jgi:Tfp pilus assembly protein PilN